MTLYLYEKGGVIKHIRAPARVEAELPGLLKKNAWRSGIGSPLLHNKVVSYKQTKNLTQTQISNGLIFCHHFF